MVQFQKQTLKQRLFWQIWWTGNKNFRTILILIFFLRTFFAKKLSKQIQFLRSHPNLFESKIKKKEKEEKQLKMQKRILILGNANFLKKLFFSLFLKNFILFHFICIWVQKNVFIFCSPQFFFFIMSFLAHFCGHFEAKRVSKNFGYLFWWASNFLPSKISLELAKTRKMWGWDTNPRTSN